MSSAHQRVNDLLSEKPLIDSVDLSYLSLRALDDSLVSSLAALTNLSNLSLAGNALTSLPLDLTDLSQLVTLDVSENPFTDVRAYLPGLMSLPALRHLRVTLEGRGDADHITLALPKLETLNGSKVGAGSGARSTAASSSRDSVSVSSASRSRPSQSGGYNNNTGANNNNYNGSNSGRAGAGAQHQQSVSLLASVRQEDVDLATRTFSILKGLKSGGGGGGGDDSSDRAQQALFDAHYKDTMAQFHARVADEEDPFVRHGYVLKARHQLFDICFAEAVDTTSAIYPELAHVLKTLRGVHDELVADVPRLLKGMSSCYIKDLADLQSAVRRSDKETTELLEAAELLEQETHVHIEEKKALTAEFERERAILMDELQHLQRENDKLAAKLQRAGGGSLGGGNGAGNNVTSSFAGGSPRSRSPGRQVQSQLASSAHTPLAKDRSAPQVRSLSRRQLIEVIEEIYDSKSKFDAKCAAAHLPRETMEQHLYSWLNTKYGLKTLILEWASAIIHAVKKFSEEDNDVAVFGAILRNEIDEEFRFVQRQLKDTVLELVRVYLKGKHPLKTEGEISELLKKKTAGSLQEEEWSDVVKYMYNAEDSLALIVRIKDTIRNEQLAASSAAAASPFRVRAPRSTEISSKQQTSIEYAAFLKCLLEFQMRGHEKFLLRYFLN